LQQGPYPTSLKRSIGGDYGHLNNHQAADLLGRIYWSGMKHFLASHISEKNNQLELVKSVLAPAMGCDSSDVDTAEQDSASGWRVL